MPKAVCKTCGKEYFGWSLISIPGQKCDCGGELLIVEAQKKEAA